MNRRSSPDVAAGLPASSSKGNDGANKKRRPKLVLGTPSSSDEEVVVQPRSSIGTVSSQLEIDSSDDEVTLSETKQRKKSPKQRNENFVNLVNADTSKEQVHTKKKRAFTSPGFDRKQKRRNSAENEAAKAPVSNKRTNKSNDQVVDLTGSNIGTTRGGSANNELLDLTGNDDNNNNDSRNKLGSVRRKKSPSKPTGQPRTKQFPRPNVAGRKKPPPTEAKRSPAATKAPPKPSPFSSFASTPTRQSSPFSFQQEESPPTKPPPPSPRNVARLPEKSNYDSDDSSDDEWMSRRRWRQRKHKKTRKNGQELRASSFARPFLKGKTVRDEVDEPDAKRKVGSTPSLNDRKKAPFVTNSKKKAPVEIVDLLSSDSEQDDEEDFFCRQLAKFNDSPKGPGTEATAKEEQDVVEEDSIVRSLANLNETTHGQGAEATAKEEQEVVEENAAVAEDDEDQDSIDRELSKFPEPDKVGPYSYDEFCDIYEEALDLFGQQYGDFDKFQKSKKFFRKFEKEDHTDTQTDAQYGRMLPAMTQELVERIYPLEEGMVFADVGSGDGIVCLQVALTTGCEARGVELMENRNHTAMQMHGIMDQLHRDITDRSHLHSSDGRPKEHQIGKVDLQLGRFEDRAFREFLSEVDLLFCNNYNEVFGERGRVVGSQYVLDDFLIGLLCLLKEGAGLVTLNKMKILSENSAKNRRLKAGFKMNANDKASFFDVETFYYDEKSEKDELLSFRSVLKEFTVYKYTRNKNATFLCATRSCPNAQGNVPIQAWRELDDGKVVLNKCELCDSCSIAKYERDRNKPDRLKY